MGDADDEVWAVVVAGGSGSRFGGAKQFAPLAGRTVLEWATDVAQAATGHVVVVAPERRPPELDEVEGAEAVVDGGSTRAASVRRGLAAVPESVDVVVVHDAARPLASLELFERTVAAVVGGADGATPVVAVTDTLRRRAGGVIDRDDVVAVQTPQAFRASALRAAHASTDDATDDAGLVEAEGGRVVTVEGDRWNLKITSPEDLVVAAALLAARGGAHRVDQ